jgi:hypothetical protein
MRTLSEMSRINGYCIHRGTSMKGTLESRFLLGIEVVAFVDRNQDSGFGWLERLPDALRDPFVIVDGELFKRAGLP